MNSFTRSFSYGWLADIQTGVVAYFLSSTPVLFGILFGIDFVENGAILADSAKPDLAACYRFDALHYEDIVEHGYSYKPRGRSNVAFFPGYPLTARLVGDLTGWSSRWILLLLSNLMLIGAFTLFSAYLRSRFPEENPRDRFLILALFGLWAAGFFFRMPYSESTFLFWALVAMLGMVRRWPLPVLAVLTGIVTAVRPVGVAAVAALACYIFFDKSLGSLRRRILTSLVWLPIACWGLIVFMAYQYVAFDAPLAFAQTQDHWTNLRAKRNDPWQKVESLLAAEPIWAAYTSDPERNWQVLDGANQNPLFSMPFWNPIFFVAACVLIFVGAAKSWLAGPEIVLSAFLLGIPYVTRAYEMCMASHARFAAIVFPAYIVLGRLLKTQPEWLTWATLGALIMLLMAWSAMFASGFPLY